MLVINMNRLKAERIAKGWNQEDLARKVNKERSSIAHYEKGTKVPPSDVLLDIIDALGFDESTMSIFFTHHTDKKAE